LQDGQRHVDDRSAGAHIAVFVYETTDLRLDVLGGLKSSWHR